MAEAVMRWPRRCQGQGSTGGAEIGSAGTDSAEGVRACEAGRGSRAGGGGVGARAPMGYWGKLTGKLLDGIGRLGDMRIGYIEYTPSSEPPYVTLRHMEVHESNDGGSDRLRDKWTPRKRPAA
jgi:hypothetical protein